MVPEVDEKKWMNKKWLEEADKKQHARTCCLTASLLSDRMSAFNNRAHTTVLL
ncbi:MAG: hypothetical protein ACI9ON_004087, partial [Limisphaerales bacterium]